MIKVTSRQMQCILLTPDFSQMPAIALQQFSASNRRLFILVKLS